jgi:hypothetical protein
VTNHITTQRKTSARSIAGVASMGVSGIALVVAIGLAFVHFTQRDGKGYYTSPIIRVASGGYAITSEGVRLANLDGGISVIPSDQVTGRVRIQSNSETGTHIFVGIAPKKALDSYLHGVSHSTVTDIWGASTKYMNQVGARAPSGAPTAQPFWVARATGPGQRTLDWKVTDGEWEVAVMNADGSPGVHADVEMAAKTSVVGWIALGALIVALITGIPGALLLFGNRGQQSEPLNPPVQAAATT